MHWVSSISLERELGEAVDEASAQVRAGIGDSSLDLLLAFVSVHHAAHWDAVPRLVQDRLGPQVFVGCSAGGVIGQGREIESGPGLTLVGASLPGVEIASATVDPLTLGEVPAPTAKAWTSKLGWIEGPPPEFVVLADPFAGDPRRLIAQLDAAFPTSTKIGGLASGGTSPDATCTWSGSSTHRRASVVLALRGNLEVSTLVTQGCRAIGAPMFVTALGDNLVRGLDGRPAVELLHETLNALPNAEREAARRSLFLGVGVEGRGQSYESGDFLIRNLLGIDPDSGGLAVAANIAEHDVVQFHVRDAASSSVDLQRALTELRQRGAGEAAGGLLFECLGRGKGLYGEPDHDSDLIREALGPVPLGGFFCSGEIGPVGARTFLHGYTASLGLFRPAPAQ